MVSADVGGFDDGSGLWFIVCGGVGFVDIIGLMMGFLMIGRVEQ